MSTFTYLVRIEKESGSYNVSGMFQVASTPPSPTDQLVAEIATRHSVEKRKVTIIEMFVCKDS